MSRPVEPNASLTRTLWRKFILSFFLAFALAPAQAQPGTIDASFNPGDPGFGSGEGANNKVICNAVQADGKILLGGDFTTYNGTTHPYIIRLNTNGGVDGSFSPNTWPAGGGVQAMAVQPDGKILIAGAFTTYGGIARNHIARLNTDGTLDATFLPGAGTPQLILAVALQPDGKILIGGNFTTYNGTPRNYIARLNTDGSLDTGFNPGTGADVSVISIAVQGDGKILIGGFFSNYNGTSRNRMARLNADGSLDTSFDPGTGMDNAVRAIGIQTDGKIIIGGSFAIYNGVARNFLARLNADGTLDNAFNVGTGAQYGVEDLVLQPDGKVLIVGNFTTYNGTSRNRVARVNADGSLDTGFNPGSGANDQIFAAALQSDGKVVLGGWMTTFNGLPTKSITRVNADGSKDSAFNPTGGVSGVVRTIMLQPDGKILLGGSYSAYNGVSKNNITRLNADGSIDAGFNSGVGTNAYVYAIALQSDGKILIGGGFNGYINAYRICVARINPDGTPDFSFNTDGSGANGMVNALAVQPDGKVLVGGGFSTYNGGAAVRIVRANTDGSADAGFTMGAGPNADVFAIALQPDGKILIAGNFTSYNGTPRNYIARLNADGSLDTGFNAGAGANNQIWTMVRQPDGKILIGGAFTTYNGTARNRIARLNADGTLDSGFDPGTGANSTVYSLALQADGLIVAGGAFTSFNGTTKNYLVRVNANGALDCEFTPVSGANNIIQTTALQADGRILIGGNFTSYDGTGRNRLARVNSGSAPPPTGATVGSAQTICANGTTTGLDGNTPVVGTGAWSVVSGGAGSFSPNASTPNATFSHTSGTGPVVLRWTITSGCSASFANLSITLQTPITWYADADGDGAGDPASTLSACAQPGGYVSTTGDECPTDENKVNAGSCGCGNPEPGAACNDGNASTINDVIGATCVCAGTFPGILVAAKVVLEGPYNSGTGLMNDNLRTLFFFPLTEPYTALGYTHVAGGGETVAPAVLAISGNDAVVDWVVLELRDAVAPATVLATRSALLQRDGDVVGADGGLPVSFNLPTGNYLVAIRHRNHLAVMTLTPVGLSGTPASVDFTTVSTATYGMNARKTSGGAVPVQVLWAGDVTFNGDVKYTGIGNDRDPILTTVGSTSPNSTVADTYSLRDVNMNGQVQYTGSGNDPDPILVNVGSTAPNNLRVQQLP